MFDKSMIKLPVISEPTLEQKRDRSIRWQNRVSPMFINNWSEELKALSVPTIFIDFPEDVAREWWEIESLGDAHYGFSKKIDDIIKGESKFFRLNSRSPKDACNCISSSGDDILKCMAGSERMIDDLIHFKHSDEKALLCIRDLIDGLSPEQEFRCFIDADNIMAVAAYFNTENFVNDVVIRSRIDDFLKEKVIPFIPVTPIVVDLVVQDNKIILLEMNPYGLSDPVGANNYEDIEKTIPGIARNFRNGF